MAPEEVDHASKTYLAEPPDKRRGIALCLSGGGYRAALFHLGALRRLNELGVLSQVDTISSVSGGSIVAAFLSSHISDWPEPGKALENFDEVITNPVWDFTSRNIRTWPFLKRLIPWNRQAAVDTLARTYERHITPIHLKELPAHPRFVFCATDMSFGVNWVFERTRVGSYRAGYKRPAPEWPVARAVAASSCFPPIFNPMRVGIPPSELKGGKADFPDAVQRAATIEGLRLSDGGVYDNMGLEPVWKTHKVVLVSDGGATFDFGPDRGLLWRLQRYSSIVGVQASAIRKRWLVSNFKLGGLRGAYWGVGSAAASFEDSPGYSRTIVRDVIGEIRTDLDRFNDSERAVLQNHGYLLADAAISTHLPGLVKRRVEPEIPYPDWMDESRVRRELKRSRKQSLLGRH